MPHRQPPQQVNGILLVTGITIIGTGVATILIQISIAHPQLCTGKVQRRLYFKALLIEGNIVVDGPVFLIDDAADHVPKLVVKIANFQ